jgi:hypothetical protein
MGTDAPSGARRFTHHNAHGGSVGIEMRKGRPYLYQRRRVDGRAECEYLGPLSPAEVSYFRGRADADRAAREVEREEYAAAARRAAAVLDGGAEFDRLADRVFRAVMYLSGFAPHNRGEWRHKRGSTVNTFSATGAETVRPPLVQPPVLRPEDQDVLDRAGRGDWSALPQVRELLKDRAYLDAIGGAGEMALFALIAAAAGNNVAVAVAMQQKHGEYLDALLADSPDPTFAERLAATRAAHNWLAVHILECMLGMHQATSAGAITLERRVTQAERRLHTALRSLAVLRRLRRALPKKVGA